MNISEINSIFHRSIIMIPCRIESSRLHRKALLDCEGKTLLQRTYERAQGSLASKVMVISDSPEIQDYCNVHRMNFLKIEGDIPNGTVRCSHAISKIMSMGKQYDIVVNWQVDEPLISFTAIDLLIHQTRMKNEIGTIVADRPPKGEDKENPNITKVVTSETTSHCMWFSRLPMVGQKYHCGIYCFPVKILSKLTRYCPTEKSKSYSLEQLTWLENGFKIHSINIPRMPLGVNTEEDLLKYRELLNEEH